MKVLTLSTCFLLFLLLNDVSAQQLTITDIQIATSIENRQPMGTDTLFTSDVGRVFCFTQVEGAADTTKISQIWYYKDQEKARVELDVQSDNWRTWSSKSISKSWIGPWRVMIIDTEGNVLATKSFKVQGKQ